MPARLALLSLLVAGCITHLPVRSREHMQIHWARDFADAGERARREHKPILAVLVAGKIDGPC
jgi:hypothetical protein